MSKFKILQKAVKKHFKEMIKNENSLYSLNLEKNELWNIYINSFPEGTNEIYIKKRDNDCSACRHFINSFGDTVAIINNKIINLWDFNIEDNEYKPVIKALSNYIKSKTIKDVFFSKEKEKGLEFNHQDKNGTIIKWHHFHISLPSRFIKNELATIKGEYRDIKNIFKRSLEEISEESVLTILELISQNSLYKGEEWKQVLTEFSKYQKEYHKLDNKTKEIYLWDKSTKIGIAIGKIRNHSIGTLLINVTAGMDLDIAVKKYEVIVAPTNYKRPNTIYTKKMLEDAKKKLEELGFLDSLQRRYAILEDISINNVLFSNKDIVKKLQDIDIFDEMEKGTTTKPKTFNRVEEIGINKFITNVLPTTKTMEVYLEDSHTKNMVSVIAPNKANTKTMFKWDNNFSWAYTGNITDSDMKTNVKNAGGKVDGVLRFSIQWNDGKIHNKNDLDAHCIEPNGNEINFLYKSNRITSGILDVDITMPEINKIAVENITWTNMDKMQQGTYKFFVRNYSDRGGIDGFRAEIEYNGQIYKFNYDKSIRTGQDIQIAEVMFDGKTFTIKEKISSETSSREIWNVKTNTFVPVSIAMYSPNYWNEQKGNGNKHYFFMLKDCVNDENPNGFFNEYLNNELTKHRKVFEALGSKMRVDVTDNQLSGLGFSSTQKNSIIVRIKGQTNRILKIKI